MPEFLKLKKSDCRNCYKCIRHCPVKSIRFSGNQAHVVYDECILCGQCYVICPQNAKETVDETEIVDVLLAGDAPVYASVAPSFIAYFEGASIRTLSQSSALPPRRRPPSERRSSSANTKRRSRISAATS